MQLEDKQQIADMVKRRMVDQSLSQADVVRLSGMNKTNVSHIVTDKWQDKPISNDQWGLLARFVGFNNTWVTVETDNFRRVHKMCADAQVNHIMLAISDKQGIGKSHALKNYKERNPLNTFYVECNEHWSKKDFLNDLRRAVGLDTYPQSITDNVNEIVAHLLKLDNPLLIIDEADELKDGVFRFIKTFYNLTQDATGKGRCGYIICGGNHLKKRVIKGVRLCKQSFQEIFSRLGGQFKTLNQITPQVITAICHANGITDPQKVTEICNATINEQDLRLVERRIHATKLMENRKQNPNKD